MAKKLGTAPKRRIFNLLKPYTPPATGWDRVYEWLIGKAKVVMILAEVIVAISFVIKVGIDTQAKGLEEQIKARDLELQQFAALVEPELRTLQRKSQSYAEIWNKTSSYSSVLKEIYAAFPNPGANLLVSISGNEVVISGSDDLDTLSQIEAKLKVSTSFSQVSLSQLNAEESEEEEDSTGSYTLNATISPKITRKLIGV